LKRTIQLTSTATSDYGLQMNTQQIINFCPSCGTTLQADSKFCSKCGLNLASFVPHPKVSLKSKIIIGIIGLILFLIGWFSQESLIGKAPTEAFKGEEAKPAEDEKLEPSLQALKDQALKNPKDKSGWGVFARALTEKLTLENSPKILVFEAIGALRQILDIDPKDKEALLIMAEISFQQQAFAKSAEFYQKYLEIVPDDLDMRARLASSLSFVGKFEESLKELDKVLQANPKHFHALAYSAVTYAGMGNKDKAKELGDKALEVAPSNEAKERLAQFLSSLDKNEETQQQPPQQQSAESTFDPLVQIVIDQVKNNPVAGKKFVTATMESNDTLKISLDNFPMEQMPPFVREKFLNTIKEKAFLQGSPLSEVILYDQTRALELQRLKKGRD
jgi:tetratricopeptide (TPR) repeat protein